MGKKEKDTRKRVMFISSVGGHLTPKENFWGI